MQIFQLVLAVVDNQYSFTWLKTPSRKDFIIMCLIVGNTGNTVCSVLKSLHFII